MRLAVISDIHLMGPVEMARFQDRYDELTETLPPLRRRWRRGLHRVRRGLWNGHPHWRTEAFFLGLEKIANWNPDWIVANGDYAGDYGGVGLSSAATFESAAGAVQLIRAKFADRARFIFGDHDIGKYSTLMRSGGIRLSSLDLGEKALGIPSFWHQKSGLYHLIGLNSSLLTLDFFLPEALKEEIPEWQRRRDRHIQAIRLEFARLPPKARVILFCHDPSALAPLARLSEVASRIGMIEMTVVGHLHSPGLLSLARIMPFGKTWKPKYPVARIIAKGLEGVSEWMAFRPVVCPSTFGTGHHTSGGVMLIEEDARSGALVAKKIRIPLRSESTEPCR